MAEVSGRPYYDLIIRFVRRVNNVREGVFVKYDERFNEAGEFCLTLSVIASFGPLPPFRSVTKNVESEEAKEVCRASFIIDIMEKGFLSPRDSHYDIKDLCNNLWQI